MGVNGNTVSIKDISEILHYQVFFIFIKDVGLISIDGSFHPVEIEVHCLKVPDELVGRLMVVEGSVLNYLFDFEFFGLLILFTRHFCNLD